jgi:flavin-binding protein dodecin
LGAGDYINAYSTLVRIADPTKLQLQYSGSNNSDFQVGMKVEVKIKNEVYEGEVVMTPANAPIDADESLKNVVRIEVPDLPEGVSIGQTAQFSITLDKRENVIVLPRNLVRTYMGRKYVQVLEDGLKKERDVEIGLETPTEVEIIKGLEEGESVIVN